jgi:hypothetical protein
VPPPDLTIDHACALVFCAHTHAWQVKGLQETAGGFISALEVRNFRTVTNHKVIVGK